MGSQNTRTRVKRPSMHAWYVYSLVCIKYHIIKNILYKSAIKNIYKNRKHYMASMPQSPHLPSCGAAGSSPLEDGRAQ